MRAIHPLRFHRMSNGLYVNLVNEVTQALDPLLEVNGFVVANGSSQNLATL